MANELRDRLVELIQNAEIKWMHSMNDFPDVCADHLIENGVVVPPCKVGDTVYCLFCGKVEECYVECISQSYLDDELVLQLHIRGKWSDLCLQPIYPFPEPLLFFDKEEAEQKLKEMRGGNDA